MLYLVLDTSVRRSFQCPWRTLFSPLLFLYKQDRWPNRAGGPILVIRVGLSLCG